MKTLVIIPSRLSASRLPGKPLLKINGLSIISHVFKKAQKANIGEVIVAAEDKEIVEDVEHNGGQAILTKNYHQSQQLLLPLIFYTSISFEKFFCSGNMISLF